MEAPILITTWDDLARVEDSESHKIEIEPFDCCGWIINKQSNELEYYLSTHTFYGSKHKISTKVLQSFGFNVVIKNCDANQK
jgi:hypothetical protein